MRPEAEHARAVERALAGGERICVAYPQYYEIRVRVRHLTLIETYAWAFPVDVPEPTVLTFDDLGEPSGS
jgi:hypothetical protein